MENFIAHNPTKLHFGQNVIQNLKDSIKNYGKKFLLIYGKGSVVKNGYYQQVVEVLKTANIDFCEFSGIKANPILSDVYKAVELCKKENVDSILALGGGSVIDSAKIISVAAASGLDAWQIMNYKEFPQNSLPLLAVLTLAATGTEMNGAAVVQNQETQQKIGFFSPLIFPKESFLNPEFTKTVPANQTTNGIVDLIAHSLEAFFAEGNATLSDKFVAAIIKEAMENAENLLNDLSNYDLRAKIMWAATCALNGTAYHGRKTSGDWGVHSIGHTISFLYDTTHGETLSIAFPAWLKLHLTKIPERIKKLGELVFDDKNISAKETINKFEQFFKSINAPISLLEIGIDKNEKSKIVNLMEKNKVGGMNYSLTKDEYNQIVDLMFL